MAHKLGTCSQLLTRFWGEKGGIMKASFRRSSAAAGLLAAAAAFFAAPASAALTPNSDSCSSPAYDISGTGLTVNGCLGFFNKNLNNADSFAEVSNLLDTTWGSSAAGAQILEQLSSPVLTNPDTFNTAVSGQTIIGVHWGGAREQPGGQTAFYNVTIGQGFTGFTFTAKNPGGVSNLALYSTTAPVPEPETYAMLLAGLGVVGFVARRRRPQA
jgi:hypothetical protein